MVNAELSLTDEHDKGAAAGTWGVAIQRTQFYFFLLSKTTGVTSSCNLRHTPVYAKPETLPVPTHADIVRLILSAKGAE